MVLAEFCSLHFAAHLPKLRIGLRAKLDALMDALNEQFGTSAEFDEPKGGIFLWVKLPDNVDTLKLYQAALAAGVSINPGPEWSTDKAYARSRLRLCFASPSHEQIRQGVAVLAEVCRREFEVPARIANVEKRVRTSSRVWFTRSLRNQAQPYHRLDFLVAGPHSQYRLGVSLVVAAAVAWSTAPF